MAFRVEFTPKAERDLDGLYRWVTENAPYRGPLWFDRFQETILSLRAFPERCRMMPELSTSEDTVRQLTFGRKRSRYSVYYAVFGDAVRILHIRHGARRTPDRKDLLVDCDGILTTGTGIVLINLRLSRKNKNYQSNPDTPMRPASSPHGCDILSGVRTWLLVPILAALLGAAPVTEEKLRTAQSDPSTWLTYGKNYFGWRYADLAEITPANVRSLTPKWIFQTGIAGKFETTPLVFDRMMFITGPSNHSYALDLLTGRSIWHHYQPIPQGVNVCCGQVNRGFAALGDKLFKVNLESKLIALDAKSGSVVWETVIDDFRKGYSTTVAPLVAKNLVMVGVAGAEFGVRAFVDAYDAGTGKRVWRFWTTAGPDDPGFKTWEGDSWKRGGGSIWIPGTYDPELNLSYWGTGNPGPDFFGDERKGDNLYTCALIAIDVNTGKLKWHYQFTPHDVHDWDAIADPVLMDLTIQGRKVKAVVQANRNGFYYILDRETGKFLGAKPYTKVSWADGINADGRPNLIAGQDPTEDGNKSCPGIAGGHNWQATAYSPKTALYYFTSTDGCQTYYKTKQEYIEGQWFQGSVTQGLPQEPSTGSVIAVDPATGDTKWRFESVTPPTGGVLATAGGLVFTGDREGYFMALDAKTGKPLWRFQTGGVVIAPPISYTFEGKQYIAIAAGSSMIAFALP